MQGRSPSHLWEQGHPRNRQTQRTRAPACACRTLGVFSLHEPISTRNTTASVSRLLPLPAPVGGGFTSTRPRGTDPAAPARRWGPAPWGSASLHHEAVFPHKGRSLNRWGDPAVLLWGRHVPEHGVDAGGGLWQPHS